MERATLGVGALLGSLERPADSKMSPASTLMSQMPIFPGAEMGELWQSPFIQ